jgi:hypothetical protein
MFLCVALQPLSAYAAWDYSLAAQLAMHDGLRATCGKIEPRLKTMLNNEWSEITKSNKIKTIETARKTQEYIDIYHLTLYEYLEHTWNDPEEQAHVCEAIYAQHNDKNDTANKWWWRDRFCAGVSLDSAEGSHCTAGPRVSVSFTNTMPDRRISILRIVPSSDVSFPRAGTFVEQSDSPDSVLSNAHISGTWALPDSIEFEWKEWPSAFAKKSSNNVDLINFQRYADEVRAKVHRQHANVLIRNLIPGDVIAKLLQLEQAAKPESSTEPAIKLFFIFTQDGLRVRWEQWYEKCIERYGGDNLGLPRDQMLSSTRVCGESQSLQ